MTQLFVQRLKQSKCALSNLKQRRILRILRIPAGYSECSVFDSKSRAWNDIQKHSSFRLRPHCNVQMKHSGRKPALLSSSGD